MRTILTNAVQLVDNQLEACEISIQDGIIEEIGEGLSKHGAKVMDCNGNLVVPGFIDVHVHLREPGGEAKETIETGTRAAAKGGFTTVCAMPNTNPVPDNHETLDNIKKKIEDTAHVRVLPYASITKGLSGEFLSDMEALTEAGAFAFTDDGVGIQTADQMLQAMIKAAQLNMPVVAHCEDNSLIHDGVVHDGITSDRLQVPGIPSVCESVQIARDVLLAEATGCHYHVCHVSTKESVRVIRDAKTAGIPVTAEVTPHHLVLNEEAVVTDDGNFKMNPPLRAKEDQQALLEGLLDGTIDFIATDHAPHTEDEKSKGLIDAPFGIVGFETAFSLLHTHLVKTGKVTLQQLIDWMTIKPALAFGLPYGQLKPGVTADITIIDLEKETVINKNSFYSKGKNTPFDHWKVTGVPVMTMVAGRIAFEEDYYEKTTARA
ncbi:dihydroorotase [Aquibacillus sediminis]|uniref:dihydroorotase n=1 Tax=Aquibacillus sediminis TaxID=2574734 RepID=UPI00110822FE|nr:dihydroorotase [Aquibacillus sediminis]